MLVRDTITTDAPSGDLAGRVAALDLRRLGADLDGQGAATIERLLTAPQCEALASMYSRDELFRSRVVMSRHGFGQGEYRYFRYPLPPWIDELRAAAYTRLAPIANRWHEAMGHAVRFPDHHDAFIARCHAAGQTRPTPLLLRYGAGDYNCLHQDLYGEHVFPLQVVLLLSQPGRDFDGGEFVMTEQRPRLQSRPMVLRLEQGDAAVITVHQRPVRGARLLPGQPAPRREPGARGPALHRWHHLSRRGVMGLRQRGTPGVVATALMRL